MNGVRVLTQASDFNVIITFNLPIDLIRLFLSRYSPNQEVKVRWANPPNSKPQGFHIFVGDLAQDVSDEILKEAFSLFPSLWYVFSLDHPRPIV